MGQYSGGSKYELDRKPDQSDGYSKGTFSVLLEKQMVVADPNDLGTSALRQPCYIRSKQRDRTIHLHSVLTVFHSSRDRVGIRVSEMTQTG